jgi:hypothetical protein
VSSGTAVAVDAAGEVLVAGSLRSSQESAEGSAFVARLDTQGTTRWVHRLESTHWAAVYSLAVDGAGTAFFGGELRGALRFAGQTVASKAADTVPDLLLGALDADGAERWVRDLPEAGEGLVEQLALDDAGRLRVRGRLLSPADLGQGALLPGPFVASYALDGTPRGARSFDPHLSFSGLALQPGGGVVLGGSLDAAVEVDGRRLEPEGPTDLLYLQLQ